MSIPTPYILYKDTNTRQNGAIVFDKDKDIDSTLKELTKDSTIPLTKLKEFIRITKEHCPTNNNIKNTHTESTTHTTQANTSHIHNNPTSIDSKSTNNTSKDSHTTESKDYLLGEEIDIVFKEQWENKQVRFFAYIYKPHKDIGVDVEIRVYHYIIQSAYTEQEEEAWYKNEKLWTTIDIISLGIALIPIGGLAASAGIKAGAEGTKVIVRWAGKKLTKRNLRMRNTQNKTTIQQYEYKIIRHITRSTNRVAKPKYPKQSIHTMPQSVRARYEERVKNNWKRINDKFNGLKRRRAGGKWKNEVAQLPTKDKQGNPLEYIENDVNIILGGKRDAERIVIGRNKNTKQFNYDYIYYTKDHYESFIHITPK